MAARHRDSVPRTSRLADGALLLAAGVLLLSGGCRPNMDPASYITGLRVFMIQAQPPEVPPGQTSTVSALAVDTLGRPVNIAWSQCLLPPNQGQAVNPDCLTGVADGGSDQPLGSGTSVVVTMPTMPSVKGLGLADATGGLYLPLLAQLTAGTDSLLATYGLRVNITGEPSNQNPMLASVSTVVAGPGGDDAGTPGAGEVVTPIDPATPIPVHANDQLTLRVAFAAGSAESYVIPAVSNAGGAMARTVTETLSVSYFTTAGSLSGGTTGVDRPDELLKMDTHLPAAGTQIDLWIVGRDERGGADALHRTLLMQ